MAFVLDMACIDHGNNLAVKIMISFFMKFVYLIVQSCNEAQRKKQQQKNLPENPFDRPFCLKYSRRCLNTVCTYAEHTVLAVAVDGNREIGDVNFLLLEIHDSILGQSSNNDLYLVSQHRYFVPIWQLENHLFIQVRFENYFEINYWGSSFILLENREEKNKRISNNWLLLYWDTLFKENLVSNL